MYKGLKFGIAGAAMFALASATAIAATEEVSETRAIDARVTRVKLDGVIDLKVRQGPEARLVISGDPRYLAKTTTVQNGDTLNIETESRGIKLRSRERLRAELTLPQLREVSSDSVGSTEVSGFSGDALELSLEGAGAMKATTCNYKTVNASLGGVGSMTILGIDGDSVELNLRGAGYLTLTGRSKSLKANLAGLGSLDAQQFQAETVSVDLSGLGNATVTAKQNANLSLSGLGSVTVYGKPLNRSVSVDGLGHVSWK
jgi:hypothetical protein